MLDEAARARGEENTKKLIIEKATDYFLNYGFPNTTTQQIATDLEISKKTLYKYFPSKEHLLQAVLETIKLDLEARIVSLVANPTLSFVDKLKELIQIIGSHNARLTPQFCRDIEKIQPDHSRSEMVFLTRILPHVEKLIGEGANQGMIRGDINLRLILLTVAATVERMMAHGSTARNEFSIPDILDAIPRIFTEGILTPQARALYEAGK